MATVPVVPPVAPAAPIAVVAVPNGAGAVAQYQTHMAQIQKRIDVDIPAKIAMHNDAIAEQNKLLDAAKAQLAQMQANPVVLHD